MTQEAPTRRIVVPGIAVTVAAGAAGYTVAHGSDAAKPKSIRTAANSAGSSTGEGAAAGGGQPGGAGASPLATVDQVPADGGLILDDAGIVLTKDGDGKIQGFSNVCTHQGCSVNAVEGGRILCPCHGSAFDARTGDPVAGPAKRPLPPVAVTVRDNSIFPA